MPEQWDLKGYLLAACSCDWGCPCSFDARPTKGFCEGGYIWEVTQGRYASAKLDGLAFAWMIHSPGPLHEGNVTSQWLIEEQASSEQRQAITSLLKGKEGGPWAVFSAVTSKYLDPVFTHFEVSIKGLESKAQAGKFLNLELSKIYNPVNGAAEELQLRKPTGFTSLWADLGKSTKFKISTSGLAYDHSGQYGEYSEFHYTPQGAR